VAALDAFSYGEPRSALLGWGSIGAVLLAAVQSVRSGAILWGLLSVVVLVVGCLPSAWTRDRTVLAPWPLLSVAAVALLAGGSGFRPEAAGYLAVAALAVLAAAELDAFTAVDMSRGFAVSFAVLTTLAVQALWIIAQYYSDRWLGTGFLSTQRELQVDIVVVASVGLLMGLLAEWYFRRVSYGRPDSNPAAGSEAR
jgi:hypothetical protein